MERTLPFWAVCALLLVNTQALHCAFAGEAPTKEARAVAPANDPDTETARDASTPEADTAPQPSETGGTKKPGEVVEIEVLVTANRTKETELESPRSLTVITEKRLAETNPITILDALRDQPGVWVFRRTATDSDPVIRGFSGANLLALVDGDTLTTLWGEGGGGMDDMYGKIEADAIERIEIVRGPASLAYGSNCLGGIINFVPRKCPFDFTEPGKIEYGGRYKFSTGTASEEYHGRAEQWLATPHLRLFLGGSARELGNTRGGGGITQKDTAGQDRNWDANAEVRIGGDHFIELLYQHMDRDHIGRHYRPGQTNSNDRDAGHLRYAYRTDGWLRELSLKSYYQYKLDRRWYPEPTNVDVDTARWDTFQETLQMDMLFGSKEEHHVVAGLAFELDQGLCPDDEQFMTRFKNGTKTKSAPDSEWYDYAIFAMDEWQITDDFKLSFGLRLDYFTFFSDVDRYYRPESATLDPMADEISAYKTIPSGSAGFVYRLPVGEPDLRLYGNASRGFRLNPPVFGVTQHAQGVRVPSPMLEPVTGDSYELGVRNSGEYLKGSLCGYYTFFKNFQAEVPSTYNGQDWFDFNGDGVRQVDEAVIALTEVGKAHMWGVEFQQDFRIDQWVGAPGHLWLGAGFAYNRGEDEEHDPIRFTHPMWGLAKVRWEQGDLWKDSWVKDLYFEYQGRFVRRYDRIPAGFLTDDRSYLRDPRDSTSGLIRSYGLPGWSVHDFRCGLRLHKYARLSFGVDNITDKRYRAAHSRADGAGRNFWLGAEFKW